MRVCKNESHPKIPLLSKYIPKQDETSLSGNATLRDLRRRRRPVGATVLEVKAPSARRQLEQTDNTSA